MRRTLSILTLALFLLASHAAQAALAVPTSVEALTRSSDAVVQARVEKRESYWSSDKRHIYSLVTLRTAKVWRGSAPEQVVLQVPGGEVGKIGQRVDAAATFDVDEQVVVFISRGVENRWGVQGMAMGKFKVEAGQVRPNLAAIQFTGKMVPAGERAVGPMSLEELERIVRAVK